MVTSLWTSFLQPGGGLRWPLNLKAANCSYYALCRDLPPVPAPITVSHLGRHTSGVRDFWELMAMADRKPDEPFSNGEVFELIARQKMLNFKPGDYVELHVGRESHLLRETTSGLAARLDPARFLRVRHSTIVKVERIKEIRPLFRGEYLIVLRDGTELTSSRRYRRNLDAILTP